jgi:hypothetical protein
MLAVRWQLKSEINLRPHVLVNFSEAYGPVYQTDACSAFELTPSTWTIVPAQAGTVTDTTATGNRFNLGNLPDEFEVHASTCY